MTAPAFIGTANYSAASFSTASTTWFWALGCSQINTTATANDSTLAETMYVAGTLDNFVAKINSNNRATDSTITIYKNGSASAVGVTVTAGSGAATFRPAGSSTLAVAANDTLSVALTLGTGAGSLGMANVSATWTPASGTTKFIGGLNAAGSTNATTNITAYMAFGGTPIIGTVEASEQMVAVIPGVLRYAGVSVSANTRVADITVRTRVNGSNGGQSFTIPASSGAGYFKDASGSDTLAVNDLFNMSFVVNGAGSTTLNNTGAYFDSTTDTNSFIGAFTRSGLGITSGTKFSNCNDGNIPSNAANTSVRSAVPIAVTLSSFGALVRTNSSTSDTLFNLQVNAASVNQNFTVPAGSGNAIFKDAVNSDAVGSTDTLLVQISGHNATISVQHVFAKTVTTATGGVANDNTLMMQGAGS